MDDEHEFLSATRDGTYQRMAPNCIRRGEDGLVSAGKLKWQCNGSRYWTYRPGSEKLGRGKERETWKEETSGVHERSPEQRKAWEGESRFFLCAGQLCNATGSKLV